MRLAELFRLVLTNLLENRFKAVLTSLGILVGAATIVMVIAIGEGGQRDVEEQFKNLSAGSIEISYSEASSSSSGRAGGPGGPGGTRGAAAAMPAGLRVSLSDEDVEDIRLFVPGISEISLYMSGKTTVIGGDLEEELNVTVVGAQPEYQEITNLTVALGTFLTDSDNENETKAAVLGAGIAEEIFGSAREAVDNTVLIDDRLYTVAGVLESMGSVVSGISPDDAVYLPLSTARKYVLGTGESPKITAVAADVKAVSEIITEIEAVLAQNYSGASFTITDAGSKMEAATATSDTLSAMLAAVAAIVFLVGGIGVMNVLFVSVRERTREIGILLALGAQGRDILLLFLVEAAMISALGGALGVGLAFGLMPFADIVGVRAEPGAQGAVLAMLFALITGTAFGFYPAWRASRLAPIEALNQE